MKSLLLSICLLVCVSVQAAPAAVTNIQEMLVKPAILCGRFDQSKQLNGMKKPLASNGRFCLVTGKGILWRTLQPFPSALRLTRDEIVNFQGDRVASRIDAKQEPTVRTINRVLFSMLAGDLSQLDSLFEIDATADGKHWHVALKAKEPTLAKAIGAIELDGDKYVKNIVINDASGDRTAITFSAMQTGDAAMLPEEAALF